MNKHFLVALMIILSNTVVAQKIMVIEGDLKLLKGQTSINVEFAYDNMIIGTETPESTFIANKKKAWDEREPGKGEEWEQMWFESRTTLYEPEFRSVFTVQSGLLIDSLNSPYTLIFKTVQSETGWTVGVLGTVASINSVAWIVDSKDRNKVIAKLLLPECKGQDSDGGDFEMGRRLKQAYAFSAKLLGWYIKKQKKK
jgi:hypothetical protein